MMSRTALLALTLLAPPAPAEPLEHYRELTRVAVTACTHPADGREIVVCGRRAADRWRAPLVGYAKGDPRGESVAAERERLSRDPPPPCGNSVFTYMCKGAVGIGVSTSLAGPVTFRTPAD